MAAQNYPFCTIDPNIGVVPVPDPRLAELARIARPERVVPTVMEFVDIAGLVAGASRGEGLGNQFLGHIRETDAIAHVVRCFEDPDVVHVGGRIDPVSDVETIRTELALADLETVQRHLSRAEKAARAGDQEARARMAVLNRLAEALDATGNARNAGLSEDQSATIRSLNLLTLKPVMYIANVDEAGLAGSAAVEALTSHLDGGSAEIVTDRRSLLAFLLHKIRGTISLG